MSRTRKGSKAPGWEYWSRRPMSGRSPSAENKRICHGIERARARRLVRDGLAEAWLPGGPYPAADVDAFESRQRAELDRIYDGFGDDDPLEHYPVTSRMSKDYEKARRRNLAR